MDVEELLKQKLKEIGADGLCNEYYFCGCSIDDIGQCEHPINDCVAAKKYDCKKCETPTKCSFKNCFRPIEDVKNG